MIVNCFFIQVHSIFSLLSLHHAYVTNMGKLVGIVSMSEVKIPHQINDFKFLY